MSGWNETAWFSILTGAAVKSTAVLAAACLATALMRGRSAAARHLLWSAAFAAILALPFLSAGLPALRIPVAGAVLPAPGVVFDSSAASTDGEDTHSRAPAGTPRWDAAQGSAWRPDWRLWLMLAWAAGATLALARTLLAYAAAWHLRRSAAQLPGGESYSNLAQTLGIRRPVALLQTGRGCMPMTFGVGRPVILMPAEATLWSEDRRRTVVLHEMAHVRRNEAATHLLARTAIALYWWHPLAWRAWHEFLKERERATDDLVLNAGARATEYAGHLLEVARGMQTPAVMAWAAAGMARRSQLEGRLLAILDSGTNRSAPGRGTVLAAVVVGAALILPLAAVRAQENQTQAIPADIDAAIRAAQSQKNYAALEAAAKAATQSRKYDAAQKLLEAAVAMRAETAGEQSVEYGLGLVKLAELEQKRDRLGGARLYAKAAGILGERPEAARALTHLGLTSLMNKEYGPAFEFFERAQLVDPAQAGVALMWMAVVRTKEGNAEEAERLFQSALAAQDAATDEAAIISRVYSQFLRDHDRADAASEMESRANAIQKTNAKPAPALPGGVYRIGNGVKPPSPVEKPEPGYSEEARMAKLQGTVIVQLQVGADGLAHEAQVVRGLGLGLDENALEAIAQWRFKPAIKDGQPVTVAATIEVNFRLL